MYIHHVPETVCISITSKKLYAYPSRQGNCIVVYPSRHGNCISIMDIVHKFLYGHCISIRAPLEHLHRHSICNAYTVYNSAELKDRDDILLLLEGKK
jgi:hypothetical protein